MRLFGKTFGSKQPAPPCAIHAIDKTLVRDEDVAWWNGLSLDDCKVFEQQDNLTKVAAIQKFMEEDGLSEEEAAKKFAVTSLFTIGLLKNEMTNISLCRHLMQNCPMC